MRALRRALCVRLIAGGVCGLIFLAECGGLLVYAPSGRGASRDEVISHAVLLACGPIAMFFFVMAFVIAGRMSLRDDRVRRNLCADCGYDLRALPGRCPECGTVAAEV